MLVTRAAEIADAEGFQAVTITRLATELGANASDITVHFETAELAREAIVWAGVDVFAKHVTERASTASDGIAKLRSLLLYWIDYAESEAYRGSFVAGAGELPNHLRELIATLARSWLDTLAEHARLAVEGQALPATTDPHQLAFEVHGLVQEANWAFGVLGDEDAYDRARRGINNRLDG